MNYATDGRCHNAEPGTYVHECRRPAVFIGTAKNGFQSGFCADCRENGWEARQFTCFEPVKVKHEILA